MGLEKARTLLLEAVESLTQAAPTVPHPAYSISNHGSSGSEAAPTIPPPANSANPGSFGSEAGPSGSSRSATTELNRLFNFVFEERVVSGREVRAPKFMES